MVDDKVKNRKGASLFRVFRGIQTTVKVARTAKSSKTTVQAMPTLSPALLFARLFVEALRTFGGGYGNNAKILIGDVSSGKDGTSEEKYYEESSLFCHCPCLIAAEDENPCPRKISVSLWEHETLMIAKIMEKLWASRCY